MTGGKTLTRISPPNVIYNWLDRVPGRAKGKGERGTKMCIICVDFMVNRPEGTTKMGGVQVRGRGELTSWAQILDEKNHQ